MIYETLCHRIIANSVQSPDCGYQGTRCWEWTGAKNSRARGLITIRMKTGPRRGKPVPRLAYRVSFDAFTNGRKLGSRVCLHLCNNENCVNPAHLRAGTLSQNMQLCVAAGRHGNSYRHPVRDLVEGHRANYATA